jgi:peptidoglycan hydrolase CwlO-like protein
MVTICRRFVVSVPRPAMAAVAWRVGSEGPSRPKAPGHAVVASPSRTPIRVRVVTMARLHVPYACVRSPRVLGAALVVASVAAAATIGLPAVAATSGGQTVPPAPATKVTLARQRVRDLEQQLASAQATASQGVSDYAAANARVAQLETAIRLNTAQLALTQAHIGTAQTALAERVVALYADPPPSLIQVLVSSGSISTALDSYDLLHHIADADMQLVRRYEGDRTRLTTLTATLKSDAAHAISERASAAWHLQQLRTLAGQQSTLLASATTALSGAEASAAQLAALRAEQARAAAAASAHATPPQVVSGTPHSGGGSSGANHTPSGSGSGSSAGSGSVSVSGGLQATLWRIARCESGGNPHAVSPDGQYRGMFQFTYSTWASVGGHGDPAAASVAEQFARAAILYERDGPGQWPVCGA